MVQVDKAPIRLFLKSRNIENSYGYIFATNTTSTLQPVDQQIIKKLLEWAGLEKVSATTILYCYLMTQEETEKPLT